MMPPKALRYSSGETRPIKTRTVNISTSKPIRVLFQLPNILLYSSLSPLFIALIPLAISVHRKKGKLYSRPENSYAREYQADRGVSPEALL